MTNEQRAKLTAQLLRDDRSGQLLVTATALRGVATMLQRPNAQPEDQETLAAAVDALGGYLETLACDVGTMADQVVEELEGATT